MRLLSPRESAFWGLCALALCLFGVTAPGNAEQIKDPYHPSVNGSPITLMKDNMLTQSLGGRMVDLDVWVGEFIKFDDNIFSTADSKKHDIIYSTAAGFKMEAAQKDTWDLRVEGQMQYNAYCNHSEYDGFEGYFHSFGSVQFSPALSARLSVKYDNTYDNFRNQEDIYALHHYTAGAGFSVKPSPYFGVDVDYNYFGQRRDVKFLDYQDYDEHAVAVRPFYEITPNTTLYVQLSGAQADPTKSDSRYNTAQSFTTAAGAMWTYMDTARVYAEAGYKLMNFDDNGTIRDDDSVRCPVFRVGGDLAPSPDWQVGASVVHITLYAGMSSNASHSNYLECTLLNTFLTYSPGAGRFTAKLAPYFSVNAPSSDVSYKEYGMHLGVTYAFTDWFNVSSGYRYSVMDYSDQASYDRNMFTIGFAATF